MTSENNKSSLIKYLSKLFNFINNLCTKIIKQIRNVLYKYKLAFKVWRDFANQIKQQNVINFDSYSTSH